jgi:protein-L-isoaspartate(D-aspartate) O-methyltransferase
MKRRLIFAALVRALLGAQDDPFTAKRTAMVRQQIESRDVKDRRVLAAMRAVPRHLFVPPDLRDNAYNDHPLPIGYNQTISQPYIVAVMTELLDAGPETKVLEIGTGSGYQAAVLARVAGQVYTIEIVPELAKSSAELLKKLGHENVHVRHGDGYKGWPEEGPFDRIMLTAAPPRIPRALIDQLKAGGRMVAPVGRTVFSQELVVIDKDKQGRTSRRSVFPVRFVPMVPGEKE